MANKEALLDTLAYIEAHPDEHDQSNWSIRHSDGRVTYCFAGIAVVCNGWHFIDYCVINEVNEKQIISCEVKKGPFESEHVQRVAQNIFEITEEQSFELFYKTYTLQDITKCVNEIIGES